MTTPVNNIYPDNVGATSSYTLQSYIELVYVQAANNLLYGNLGALQTALQTTGQAIDALTALQNIHNKISPSAVGTFNFNFQGNINTYTKDYQAAASAFFNSPVGIKYNSTQRAQDLAQLLSVKKQLSTQIIPLLSGTTPRLSGGIEDPNSLLAKMRSVLKDLGVVADNNGNAISGGLEKWILDNYNNPSGGLSSAGSIQTDLTNAIAAGQSLNSTQTASVRNYLYLFEEYYKSAAAVLQQMTQIIQQIAQNIKT